MIRDVLAALAIVLLCVGCASPNTQQEPWFSSGELKSCESQALSAYANEIDFKRPGSQASVTTTVFQVQAAPVRKITVYITASSSTARPFVCAYYVFRVASTNPGPSSAYAFVKAGQQEFIPIEYGSVLENGQHIPHSGRRIDNSGRYYVSSGLKSGEDSDSVLLRDLHTGQRRVLVAPAGGKSLSNPWFQDDSVMYFRSNSLWRISIDGSQLVKVHEAK